MSKSLSEWLEQIGQEMFIEGLRPDGTVIQRSNDEQLARLIWDRAIGVQTETKHEDGSISVNVANPDARAQQFIFERREGKSVVPPEDTGLTPLDRVSEMVANDLNDAAEDAIDDDDDSTDNPDADVDPADALSEYPDSLGGPEDGVEGTEGVAG